MNKILYIITVITAVLWLCALSPRAAAEGDESFSIRLRAEEGGFSVSPVGGGEPSEYMLSINGGESFFAINRLPFSITGLPHGTYQICMLKNKTLMSEVRPLKVGESIGDEERIEFSVAAYAETRFKNGSVSVNIDNFDREMHYLVTLNGGRTWYPAKARKTVYSGLFSDTYTVGVRCLDKPKLISPMTEIKVPIKKAADKASLKVDLIKQNPELPTGCEVTSLAMVLKYLGIGIPKTVLADVFLEKSDYRTGDYRRTFVGDPRKADAYGCYAGVIVKTAENFFSTVSGRDFEVHNISGCELETLYSYIDMGHPVIVWATNKMVDPVDGAVWTDEATGRQITWVGNEHCMLLTGYDKNLGMVYINDPIYGMVAFKEELFEKRFYQLEQQAIVIAEITEGK